MEITKNYGGSTSSDTINKYFKEVRESELLSKE